MTLLAKRIVDSNLFRGAIIAVILLAGVLAGVETSAAIVAQHRVLLHALDLTVLAIFIIEIVLKIAAHGRRPFDYFRDGWNIFDFTIVALCVLPVGGPFAAVLRLVRTLRLLRLVTALPKLQLLVGALIKSLSAMGYVGLLLGLIFYIYAVIGIHLFGRQAPEQFGSLPVALMSLFQMITLDNWSDLFNVARDGAPLAATAYFVSFILLGTMIMLNLFIGIVMNSMAEMHAELDEQKDAARAVTEKGSVLSDVTALDHQLAALRAQLDALRKKAFAIVFMKTKHWLLALWVLIVFALHQDVWNWTKAGPLLFGLLPPGLTYHLGYSVLAAITMALLVRFAWPTHLEDDATDDQQPPTKKP